MKVLLVSQCTKKASIETRKIIDQFAERKGDSVWETNITAQGLETLKRLLRSTARKNTAVACHLLRGHLQTELLWIVGNQKKFNKEGMVPTNVTRRDILRSSDENDWHTGEAIAILVSISGLFHDFGKANHLFQKKLKGVGGKNYEPYRHEWISLFLFKAFVGKSTDKEWLEKLLSISRADEKKLHCWISNNKEGLKDNPLKGLPNIAKIVGWLIVSHHRLPVQREKDPDPRTNNIKDWMEGNRFSAGWNSPNYDDKDWKPKDFKEVLSFLEGTPFLSKTWRASAKKAGRRALNYYSLLDRDWFQDRFSIHVARAALMLSDHYYSAEDVHREYQDMEYDAYANTKKDENSYPVKKRVLKQKLDEHNIGVALNAFLIAKRLPELIDELPTVLGRKEFKRRCKDPKFTWQDKAFDLACSLQNASHDNGFFGVNLASTGCGKTLANARIMYGLANEETGCRFNVALGLRVLTLQTGDALREKLHLKNDDMAVIIGSQAFKDLHDFKTRENNESTTGNESLEDLDDEDEVHFSGNLNLGRFSRWLKSSPKIDKMLSAPILVSTIDHLITATEGCRGGKQIGPILRLLTSDLVLDEPDDFDVDDLHALCRLVNFAGVCGSRVLISSATLPPAIIEALFDAYATGRKNFNKARRSIEGNAGICCAWFDEFGAFSKEHTNAESYMTSHRQFIDERISKLEQQPILRRGRLVPVSSPANDAEAKSTLAEAIRRSIYELHDKHHQTNQSTGQKISVGLIRMANTSPMVDVVKQILSVNANSGYCLHFCVYHAKFPMIIRSKIEEVLDLALARHNAEKIWSIPEIASALSRNNAGHHIFLVFATSVAEVGRDHDYDWAIVEPSSMRSIIQLAGRVQRHRRIPSKEPNIAILQKNLRALRNDGKAYWRPGFETANYQLQDKDLSSSLATSQYETITASPRLRVPANLDYRSNLVDLEHARLQSDLLGADNAKFHASLWWNNNPDWCGVLQRLTLFRSSPEQRDYIAYMEEEGEEPLFYEWSKDGSKRRVDTMLFERTSFEPASNVFPWMPFDLRSEVERLAIDHKMDLRRVSQKYTGFNLRVLTQGKWFYDPLFGFYD